MQEDDLFNAYELYLIAGLWEEAHRLAYFELAPDALIAHDYVLLRSLLTPFIGKSINDWHRGGKALLDYADVMTRLPPLITAREETEGGRRAERAAVADATEAQQVEALSTQIPRLIRVVPEIFTSVKDERHMVVKEDMLNSLIRLADWVNPSILVSYVSL